MEIKHLEDQRLFVLYSDTGAPMGEIAYTPRGGELHATHTRVFPEYEGQGLAAKLLDALADYARQQQLTIVPVCSYVVHAFAKYPAKYADVMKQ